MPVWIFVSLDNWEEKNASGGVYRYLVVVFCFLFR